MRNSDAAKLALKLGEEKNLQRSEIADWQPLLNYCVGNPLTLRVLVGQAVKKGLRGNSQIDAFVEDIRSGEQKIEDADARQGRDKSLGASLDYGFRHAFNDDELPIIALLHLFQGTVDADVLEAMGRVGEAALPELQGKSKEHLTDLLERAREIGLLAHVHTTWFTIHPALPWFLRQLFARHYDGQAGHSTSQAALRAWVEAIGALGNYYAGQFVAGNRRVIDWLALEEANLLHARRIARRNQWWRLVTSAMQGLRNFYGYHGRTAEWARLVEEITPDYCTADDDPFELLEDDYTIVMGYRVDLVRSFTRDLARAAELQEKLIALHRQQAAVALDLPSDATLDNHQRHRLRTLGVSVFMLGSILKDQGDAGCLESYHESLEIDRRIGDKAAQAVGEYNLGHAYQTISAIRNLDAAEAAYRRSLDLWMPDDALNRSKSIKEIGMVHHERFIDAIQRKEPVDVLRPHLETAQKYYLSALELCPENALTARAPMHNQLGSLYSQIGQLDSARDHYEQAAQHFERTGDRFHAGYTRFNMALMYLRVARNESQSLQQRAVLLRARAYAEAALLDFQYYEGRAANEEARAQGLLKNIAEVLTQMPS